MIAEVSKPDTDLKIFGDYQNFLIDTTSAPYLPTTIICDKCRYTWVEFDPERKGKNGGLVPIEHRTGLPHDCSFSYPYYCNCGELIYFDNKILSPNGRRIPLNFEEDTYHFCSDYPKAKGPVRA